VGAEGAVGDMRMFLAGAKKPQGQKSQAKYSAHSEQQPAELKGEQWVRT